MCGGCGCTQMDFCFSNLMYIFEKVAAWLAMSAIISCIVITILISIGIGVGVGYNYAFVDMNVQKLEKDALAESSITKDVPKDLTAFAGDSTTPLSETGSSSSNPVGLSSMAENIPIIPSVTISAPSIIPEPPVEVQPLPDGGSPPALPSDLPVIPPALDDKETRRKEVDNIGNDNEAHLSAAYDEVQEQNKEDDKVNQETRGRKASYKRRKPPKQKKKYKKMKYMTTVVPTILIPLQDQPNLSPLISKLLGQKKNITLQFITI